MNKKSIDGLIKMLNMIESEIPNIKHNLDYIKNFNINDYSKECKSEAAESVIESENDSINRLWEINKLSEKLIKKIDMEAWRELKDE